MLVRRTAKSGFRKGIPRKSATLTAAWKVFEKEFLSFSQIGCKRSKVGEYPHLYVVVASSRNRFASPTLSPFGTPIANFRAFWLKPVLQTNRIGKPMNVLIVHAHHEPKSFSSSLANQAALSLRSQGHDVVMSDLYSMGFNPVSDRRNFTSVKDGDYLKQQAEEAHATENEGFAADVEAEIQKLESADVVIFSFPLWWFGMPGIMKGWVDRVFAAGRVYGGGQLYENGVGKSKKRGMVLMTTGGGPDVYSGWGLNPSLDSVLDPIQHGVFWFNGILPLDPFVAWSPARNSDEGRAADLQALDTRLKGLFEEAPRQLPPMSDFPNWGFDVKERFIVAASIKKPVDERFTELIPAEKAMIADWKREGKLLDFQAAEFGTPNWKAFLTIRAADQAETESWLEQLPLAEYLEFDITQIAKPSTNA